MKPVRKAGAGVADWLEPLSPADRRAALQIAFTLLDSSMAIKAFGARTEAALAFLRKRGGASAKELALELGVRPGAAQQLLYTLKRDRLASNETRGRWVAT